MPTSFALDEMSIDEKLRAMEALWDDLCRHQESLPVHQWQRDILDERERLVERGEARFLDWEEAKEDITRETS
jgi:hypothetical protein